LTFIGYLCEICSMCENMTICMEIWLSLDICVKYAQCVKIWLFLKCVQFLKSYIQFLMNTILNPAIAQFMMKKKGDACSVWASCIGGKMRHANKTRVLHLSKGRRALWRHVSLLLNMQKNLQITLHRIPLVPTSSMPVGTHMCTCVCQQACAGPTHEAPHGAQVV
jgi:hypothetical protein